jgi:L-alanine-DL-glutamate epimerase-like enolase superfamily enzyme
LKITRIRLQHLQTDLDPPFTAAWDPVPRRSFAATLVRVETDEGVVGVGSGDTMEGFDPFIHLFLGQDPLSIARHVRVLETISFHGGRFWPLEAALWDIAGKVYGQPVARLFGGFTDRIPAYASCGEARGVEARVESTLALRDQGFRALKIRVSADRLPEGINTVRAVRDAVGNTMDILVDLNQAWRMAGDISPSVDVPAARRVAEDLRELDVFWLEEPLEGNDLRGLAALRASTGMRIAGGEMARTPEDLLAYLEADALDVYQPDVVLAAGMSRVRLIAELALLRNRLFTPHTWTNGLGLLANLHVAAGVGGGPYLEFPCDPPGWTVERRDFFLAEPIRIDENGCVRVPAMPGLGAVLDEERIQHTAVA